MRLALRLRPSFVLSSLLPLLLGLGAYFAIVAELNPSADSLALVEEQNERMIERWKGLPQTPARRALIEGAKGNLRWAQAMRRGAINADFRAELIAEPVERPTSREGRAGMRAGSPDVPLEAWLPYRPSY